MTSIPQLQSEGTQESTDRSARNRYECSFPHVHFPPPLTRRTNSFFRLASLCIITHHLHQTLGSHRWGRSAQHLLLWYGGRGWTRIPQQLFHPVLFPLSISSYKSITGSFQKQDVRCVHHYKDSQFTPWAVILKLQFETLTAKAAIAQYFSLYKLQL